MNYAAACREKEVHQNFMNEIVDRTGSVQSVELCNVKSTLQGQFDYPKLLTHFNCRFLFGVEVSQMDFSVRDTRRPI